MKPIYYSNDSFGSNTSSADEILQTRLTRFNASEALQDQFVIEYNHTAYYLENSPELVLKAVFVLIKGAINTLSNTSSKTTTKTSTYCSIIKHSTQLHDALDDFFSCSLKIDNNPHTCIENHPLRLLVKHFNADFIALDRPLVLESVNIEKPWGRECWLTGIEERGQSFVTSELDRKAKTPLPWLLSLLPKLFSIDTANNPLLLKILDPLPDDVYGDLYFEMHHKKQEVYVVTHVDENAWPTGTARMRFGFDQQKLQSFCSEKAFKNAFCQSVNEYYKTRKTIDELLDARKTKHQIALNEALCVTVSKQRLQELPQPLIDKEQQLRAVVESYIGYISIKQGDVIVIPKFTPHSLMHGVRCIEFQTPVYERQILFFAQKVLTQDHWDTDAAMAYIHCQHDQQTSCGEAHQLHKVDIEQIVDFEQFEVFRYTLKAREQVDIPINAPYCLLINISGMLEVAQISLSAEQACFISEKLVSEIGSFTVTNKQESTLMFLLARPKDC